MLTHSMPRLPLRQLLPLLLRMIDVVIARTRRREKQAEGYQKRQMRQYVPVPRPFHYHDFAIHAAQATVCDADPAPRPPYPALPLPGRPEEYYGDDATHEGDLLRHVDHPVDGAADTLAIFTRTEEEGVGEPEDP